MEKKAVHDQKQPLFHQRKHLSNESFGFLKNMIQDIQYPVFVKDRDHRWVFLNQAACTMIGKQLEDLLGKTDYDHFPKEQADAFWERDEYVLRTRKIDTNEMRIPLQGEERLIATKTSPYIDPYNGEKYVVGIIRNISIQRETEEKLHRTETLLQNLLETSPDYILVFDRNLSCMYVNESAAERLNTSKEELQGKKITELLHGIEKTSLFSACARMLESGKPGTVREFYTSPEGRKEWYEVSINPLGEGILCEARNITNRIRTEESLKYRIKMESLVADISKYLLTLSPYEIDSGIDSALQMAGEFVDVDRSYIFQYHEDCKKMSNTYEWCAKGVEPQKALLQELPADIFPWWSEKMNRFETIVIPDVEKLPKEASAEKQTLQMQKIQSLVVVPMTYSDELIGFLGFDWVRGKKFIQNEDITLLKLIGEVLVNALKRKQAERELRAEQEQLISLFNSIDEVIYVTDPHTNEVLFANSFLKRLLRKNPVGDKCFHAFQNLDAPCPFCTNSIILKNKFKPYAWEFHNENLQKCYSIIDRIIKWPDGRDVRFELALDITEQKRLTEQLQQSQKMEAVGRLAGGIAHDFNNLLTAVIGYTEILKADLDIPEKQRRYVEEIRKSATRATSLTQQLLAFSRKQMLQPKIVNITTLVADTITLLRRLIGENIQLEYKPEQKLAPVKVDPGQIEQVIVNLALNARDAMPQGGKLTIATLNAKLPHGTGTYVAPGDYAVLSMRDTGSGMDEETLKRMYEPFFTTKEKGKGTGLGLSTVYGIVKQSGGFIEAWSKINSGTTFEIYLPRIHPAEEKKHKKPSAASLQRGNETILLVEDDDNVRKLIHTCLKRFGYEVLPAENGEKALKLVDKNEVKELDLLITDVVMPGMNGRTLAETVSRKYPSIKTIYMSGYTDDAIIHHGVLDSGFYFMQKPFAPADLAQKVREVLDQK